MRILFIDDEFGRVDTALQFYRRYFKISRFDHIDYIPDTFKGYDVVSFDNDLGGHVEQDTYIRLSRMLRGEVLDLREIKIYVHSMNSVAASQICQVCLDAGAVIAECIPFSRMLAEIKND